VKGGGRALKISADGDVDDLLKKTQAEVCLTQVRADLLKLYRSAEAKEQGEEAFPSSSLIQNIDGGRSESSAFYVEYPDAQSTEIKEMLKALVEEKLEVLSTHVKEKLEVLLQMSPANFRILPVPDDFESSFRDGTWSKKVKAHYEVEYCTVLSQLFPQSYLYYWFPAVSEHIVPKGQWQLAKGLGFKVSDSRNGLLLLKHLEKTYHAGKWTPIPTGNHANGVELKIYVSNDLKAKQIEYEDGTVVCGKEGGKGKLKHLTFGDLHEKIICVNPPPYMRSLYLKAQMAHGECEELPNPQRCAENYEKQCGAMKEELFQRLLRSQPDLALPVVQ